MTRTHVRQGPHMHAREGPASNTATAGVQPCLSADQYLGSTAKLRQCRQYRSYSAAASSSRDMPLKWSHSERRTAMNARGSMVPSAAARAAWNSAWSGGEGWGVQDRGVRGWGGRGRDVG